MPILVNGEPLDQKEIDFVKHQLENQQIDPPAICRNEEADLDTMARESVIARALIKQEAQRRAYEIPQKVIDERLTQAIEDFGGEESFNKTMELEGYTLEKFTEEITWRTQIDMLLDEVCQDIKPPTEEELRAYYEANKARFIFPEQVHVAHIHREVQPNVVDNHAANLEMSTILDLLKKGLPFEQLLEKYPSDAKDLGYIPRGSMFPEFEQVVFALKKDQLSEVFSTPYGLHIAKVYGHRPARQLKFNEAQDQIKDILEYNMENQVIDAYTIELRKSAQIEDIDSESNNAPESV